MKTVLFNLNVGSAIEQSGLEIYSWLKDKIDIKIYSSQTKEDHTFQYLLSEKPDAVIINGEFGRIITPIYYYKQLYKYTKIVLISRTYEEMKKALDGKKDVYSQRFKFFLKEECDYILPVNLCERVKDIEEVKNKVIDCCGINDENRFFIKKPWSQREKKFLILGSLNPHKLSKNFLEKIQETEISIDCYGSTRNQPDWYKPLFESCKNLNYLGMVPFEEVPDVLNEYKYYLLPHDGMEPFCNSLQQAILCGVLPLVLDDYCEYISGRYWLEWAKDFYFGTKDLSSYINNIEELDKEDFPFGEIISEKNRENMIKKYGVWRWKDKFIKILEDWNKEVR